MKAIRIGDRLIIPQIGYEITYTSSYGVSGRLEDPVNYYDCNRVKISTPGDSYLGEFDFNSKEKAMLFISDLVEGFEIESILDPFSDRYM